MSAGGVNKVILIGNLGVDPELRYTSGGQAVCDVRLATNESWTDKNGQKQERTEWHRVVFWGKQAEVVKQYLTKGQRFYVEGRLQTRSWDDKDGNKRYMTEVVATDFMFLGGRAEPRSDRGGDRMGDRGGDRMGGGGDRTGGGGGDRTGDRGGDRMGGGYRGRGGDEGPPPPDDYGSSSGPGQDDDIPF